MPSLLAWLDTTEEEQRVSRELMALFIEPEGRDELGIGQVRDVFSDLLFPGTSVLLTRARYYLLVPWCYTQDRARGTSGEECFRVGQKQERDLIANLRREMTPGETGLVGANLGANVRDLPSVYYWGSLIRFGILTSGVDIHHLGLTSTASDEATELAERPDVDWDPSMPAPPARRAGDYGFPWSIPGGFNLTSDEAHWLTERIVQATPDTALSTLLLRESPLPPGSFPWDVLDDGVPHLRDARLFSSAIHGAQLLYNLLLAERYVTNPDLERYDNTLVDDYRQRIEDWASTLPTDDLGTWDISAMWHVVRRHNPRIAPLTIQFIDACIDAVRTDAATIATNPSLRSAVENRERRKGKRSRFANPKLLAAWNSESGASALSYRWATIRRIVDDIDQGRNADAPA